jgi:hypothetical protein
VVELWRCAVLLNAVLLLCAHDAISARQPFELGFSVRKHQFRWQAGKEPGIFVASAEAHGVTSTVAVVAGCVLVLVLVLLLSLCEEKESWPSDSQFASKDLRICT